MEKKDSLFSKWCWENWTATCKRLKLGHFLTPHKTLKMDEKPKCETGSHQNPRGETGNNFFGPSHSNFLLDTSPKARELKAKMNCWDLIKIKSFCTAKETINKTKRNRQNGSRYLLMTYQIKG